MVRTVHRWNADARYQGGVMAGDFAGEIRVDVRDSVPDWAPYLEPGAPPGAPNVMFIVWDDVGYGCWDTYGGLVEMPTMRRIAERGVRFSQFHTTALCSPSRTALLTGRNAQTSGMGTIGEMSDGFPGLSCLIPPENGLLSEILRDIGYNTFAIGKWHLSPAAEMSMGASKRTWPLSRGFDRFYGFLGGLTDQWYPDLMYDNHPVTAPGTPAQGYHLSKDLADKTIEFIHDAKTTAPDKPWFAYVAPGAGHAPHHVFTEWSDRYRGVFAAGYEKYRDLVLDNQKRLGLIPPSTELPPLNPYEDHHSATGLAWNESDLVRPWEELSDDEKRLMERQAEVFAGFLSYTDAQIGRVLDELEKTGELDNTLIVVISDNGASAEGGPHGSVNANRWYNGIPESIEANLAQLSELGLETTCPHYSNGWAMAFNTPFKMYKTYASVEGGVADPLLISWPAGLPADGGVCDHYLHACDIVPTVLEWLGVVAPWQVGGRPQTPFDGVSVATALSDSFSEPAKHTQFYSILGTRAVWADGWHAAAVHPPTPSGWGNFDDDRWELYYLPEDRNQLHDLADRYPEKLVALKALWDELARRYNGYPLDDRNTSEILSVRRPSIAGDADSVTLHPNGSPVPEHSGVELMGRSFTITARLTLDDGANPDGVVYAMGGRFGGHALFFMGGRLRYVYNWLGEDEQDLTYSESLQPGEHTVVLRYSIEGYDDAVPFGPAELSVDGDVVATAQIRTQPGYFSISGEGATVGREVGQSVSRSYQPPFSFTEGTIHDVVVTVAGSTDGDVKLRTGFGRE
jgi:arylsulfatase